MIKSSKECFFCGSLFLRKPNYSENQWSKRTFCSNKCSATSLRSNWIPTKRSTSLKGEKSPVWKGGKNRFPKCRTCDKLLSSYGSLYCRSHVIHTVKSVEKRKLALPRGKNHSKWKGEKASYRAKHIWMEVNFGKPDTCEHCGNSGLSGRSIHWANKSGRYLRDKVDWLRLCVSCHFSYDKNKRTKLCVV